MKIAKIWNDKIVYEVADNLDPNMKQAIDLGLAITSIDTDVQRGERVYVVTYSDDDYVVLPASIFGAQYIHEEEDK